MHRPGSRKKTRVASAGTQGGRPCWSSDLKILSECGLVTKPTVILSKAVKDKVYALMDSIRSSEWLGYLIGQDFTVTDLFIPLQSVTLGSVDVKKQDLPKGIIGTVHSHHSMGAFLSGTDQEYLEGNHSITIVVADDGWVTKVRVKAPCEHYISMEADLEIEMDPNLESFVTESKGKMFQPMVVRMPILREAISVADGLRLGA